MAAIYAVVSYRVSEGETLRGLARLYCESCGQPTYPNSEPPPPHGELELELEPEPKPPPKVRLWDEHAGFSNWCEEEAGRR